MSVQEHATEQDFLAALSEEVMRSEAKRGEPRARIGRVISASGTQVLVMLDSDLPSETVLPGLGTMVCVELPGSVIMGTISAMSAPAPDVDNTGKDMLVLEVELMGALVYGDDDYVFSNGIASTPSLGAVVALATKEDVSAVFDGADKAALQLGELSQFRDVPTKHSVENLVYGNFAVLGGSGTGKSCAVVRIVREMIRKKSTIRTLIIDTNSEYGISFGTMARIVRPEPGSIPHWMLSFHELIFLMEELTGELDKDEKTLLEEAIIFARKGYSQITLKKDRSESIHMSIDTPVPYRIADVISYLDKSVHTDSDFSSAVFRRLRTRLGSVTKDKRCSVFFGSVSVNDDLASFISVFFGMPLNNKPVTLIQLGEVSKALTQVITSAIARFCEEVSRWSHGGVPTLLIVEDAHEYLGPHQLPNDSLTRLMEKGRKTNLGVGLVSSKPGLIEKDSLQQCESLFVTRLTRLTDRGTLEAIAPEQATGLLGSAGLLGLGEAIAMGRVVNMPVRMRFAKIPAAAIPTEHVERSKGVPPLTEQETQDTYFAETLAARWREQTFTPESS